MTQTPQRTRLAGPLLFPLLIVATAVVADEDLMQRPPSAACEYCHGHEGRIDSPTVPALAGQSASYIEKQLDDFRAGARQSHQDQMRSALFLLDPADAPVVARYFAGQRPSPPELVETPIDDTASRLYWLGSDSVTACVTCHAASRDVLAAGYPFLFGLNREYLARQLRAFRGGSRTNDPNGIMRRQAAALGDPQIEALADYLSMAKQVTTPASSPVPALGIP